MIPFIQRTFMEAAFTDCSKTTLRNPRMMRIGNFGHYPPTPPVTYNLTARRSRLVIDLWKFCFMKWNHKQLRTFNFSIKLHCFLILLFQSCSNPAKFQQTYNYVHHFCVKKQLELVSLSLVLVQMVSHLYIENLSVIYTPPASIHLYFDVSFHPFKPLMVAWLLS